MASVLREIVIDCRDARAVAGFWADVLGWPVVEDPEGYCWLSSTGEPTAPPPLLVFVPVPEPKTVKNRLHIDVNCHDDAERQRLVGAGARVLAVLADWTVMADPEGNEFCAFVVPAED